MAFLEIRTQKSAGVSNGIRLQEYCHSRNQVLCLKPGLQGLWSGFDRTCVRQRISRAEKSGIVVRVGKDLEDLRRFYDLHKLSSHKNGVPHRPFSFFQNMWNTLGRAGLMRVVLADIGADAGSAGIFLTSKDSIIFEFAGHNYELMDRSPAHLIIWEMIQYACKEGFRYFDFGLTPPGNTGLPNFKSRWGTQNCTLKYYYYPDVEGYKKFVIADEGSAAVRSTVLSRISHRLKASVACRMYKHFG